MYVSYTDFVTFNPGPSQLSPRMIQYIQEVTQSGFVSYSHRSAAFSQVSERAIEGLRAKMGLPKDYHIFYQPSATAGMDALLRNLVFERSYHFVNGNFSRVFFNTALAIGLNSVEHKSPLDRKVDWEQAPIADDIELIAMTHNETSTGVMWPNEEIKKLRKQFPGPLLVVDVTSTFGTMHMPWTVADVWFGSVQKCLGLPAGLGYIILGPRAFDKALQVLKKRDHVPNWQNFEVLAEYMKRYQTPETPNVMHIALLARQMEHWDLAENERLLMEKAKLLWEAKVPWKPFVVDVDWRAPTVLNLIVEDPKQWHARAKEAHMILGEGYAPLHEKCIRIANFPAITLEHIHKLIRTF